MSDWSAFKQVGSVSSDPWGAFKPVDPLEAKSVIFKEYAKKDLLEAGVRGVFNGMGMPGVANAIDPLNVGANVRSTGAQIGERLLGVANRFVGRGLAADDAHRWAQAYEQAAAELTPDVADYPAKTARNLFGSLLQSAATARATGSGYAPIGLAALQEGSEALQEHKDSGAEGSRLGYAAKQAAWEALPAILFQRLNKLIPGLGGTESALAGQGGQTLRKAAQQVAVGIPSEIVEEGITTLGQTAEAGASGVNPDAMNHLGQSLVDTAVVAGLSAGLAESPQLATAAMRGADRQQRRQDATFDRKQKQEDLAAQAETLTAPAAVTMILKAHREQGNGAAIEALAGKSPSRSEWEKAGLKTQGPFGSGQARTKFASTLKGILDRERAQAAKQPVAEEPPPATFQPEPPPAPSAGFTTAQGSTYELDAEGRTTRTKSLHKGHDPNDVGKKKRSDRTVYVAPGTATEVGMHASLNKEAKPRIYIDGNDIVLESFQGKGPNGEAWYNRVEKRFPFTTAPEVGKAPVEFWASGSTHPGNPITEIRGQSAPPPSVNIVSPEPQAPAPEFVKGEPQPRADVPPNAPKRITRAELRRGVPITLHGALDKLPSRILDESPIRKVVQAVNTGDDGGGLSDATVYYQHQGGQNTLHVIAPDEKDAPRELQNEVIAAWAWENLPEEDYTAWRQAVGRKPESGGVQGGIGGGQSNVDSFAQSVIDWMNGNPWGESAPLMEKLFGKPPVEKAPSRSAFIKRIMADLTFGKPVSFIDSRDGTKHTAKRVNEKRQVVTGSGKLIDAEFVLPAPEEAKGETNDRRGVSVEVPAGDGGGSGVSSGQLRPTTQESLAAKPTGTSETAQGDRRSEASQQALDATKFAYETPQKDRKEQQLRERFGDEAVDEAARQGWLIRSPNGLLSASVTGREQFGKIPSNVRRGDKRGIEFFKVFADITGKTYKPDGAVGKEIAKGGKYFIELERPVSRWQDVIDGRYTVYAKLDDATPLNSPEPVADAPPLPAPPETQVQAETPPAPAARGDEAAVGVDKAVKPWQMTRDQYVGKFEPPYSIKDIQAAEKTSTGARKRFNTRSGPMVPPSIRAEVGGKIAQQESTAAEMKEAYRTYSDEYKARAEAHYEAVAKAKRSGRTVNPAVLADYPDLRPPAPTPKVVGNRGQRAIPGLEEEAARMEAVEEEAAKYKRLASDIMAQDPSAEEGVKQLFTGFADKVKKQLEMEIEQSNEQIAAALVEDIPIKRSGSNRTDSERRDRVASAIEDAVGEQMAVIAATLPKAGSLEIGNSVEASYPKMFGKISKFVYKNGVIQAEVVPNNGDAEKVYDLYDLSAYEPEPEVAEQEQVETSQPADVLDGIKKPAEPEPAATTPEPATPSAALEDREAKPTDAPQIVSFVDGKFVLADAITPQQAEAGLEAVRERYKYSRDNEVEALKDLLSGEAIKSRNDDEPQSIRDKRELYRKAMSAQSDAEAERGRKQSEAGRAYERRAKEIALERGVPAGRSHGSLSSAKQYRDAIEQAKKDARKDPLVVEAERQAKLAKETYDTAAAHTRDFKADLNRATSGERIPEGAIFVAKTKGPSIAIRIVKYDESSGTYDYESGSIAGTPAQFFGHSYGGQGERGITAAAIRENYGTVEESRVMRAIGLQALQAIEDAREARFAAETKKAEAEAASDLRARYVAEYPHKVSVAVAIEDAAAMHAKTKDGKDVVTDGRFGILAEVAPPAVLNRVKLLREKGKGLGRYTNPEKPARFSDVLDPLKGESDIELKRIGYLYGIESSRKKADAADGALLTDGERVIKVAAKYYDYWTENGIEFRATHKAMNDVGDGGPVGMYKGKKLVGVVMPMVLNADKYGRRNGPDAFSLPLDAFKASVGDLLPTTTKAEEAPKKGKKKPKVQARAISGLTIPVSMEPGGKPLAAQDVIKTISNSFGVPIRSGRTGMPKRVAGIYKMLPEVIRTRGKFNADLAVISHEVGHHIDKQTNVLSNLPENIESALKAQDYDQTALRTYEGWAEYLRKWWTGEQTPKVLDDWFAGWMQTHPSEAFRLHKAKDLITQWREQGAAARAESQRKPMGWRAKVLDQPLGEKLREFGKGLRRRIHYEFLDRFERMKEYDRLTQGKGFDPGADATASQLLSAFNMSTSAHAERALLDGIHTVSSDHKVIGKGLRDVFKPIPAKDYDEWANYHIARHVLDVAEQTPDYNPGMSAEDAAYIVDQVKADDEKHARYEKVSQALTQINNDRLEMLVDAGVLTEGDKKRMLDKWGQTYTSLRRVQDRSPLQRIAASVLRVPQPVKGRSLEGSGLPIMDPVEATIQNLLDAYDAALKQQVLLKIVQQGVPEFGGVEGMGAWIEKVPPNRKVTKGQLEEILDTLAAAGFDEDLIREIKIVAQAKRAEVSDKDLDWISKRWGLEETDNILKDLLSEAEKNGVPDPDTAIALWRPDFSIKPSEKIFRMVVNGEPHLFEISPDLHDALNGMNPVQVNWLFRGLVLMTKMTKLGATGISTTFAAGNLFRDFPTFQAQTKHTKFFDSAMLPMLAAAWNAKPFNRNEVVKLWEEFGGKIATRLGGDYGSVRNVRADITGHSVSVLESASRGTDRLRDAIGLFEAGPRIAEFYGYLKEQGYSLKDGKIVDKDGNQSRPPRGVLVGAALAARDVTTDFTRAGRTARLVDQFLPFFNAAVQSNVKFARTVGEIGTLEKNWQQRAIALSVMASLSLAYILARYDDDDYKEQPEWLKRRYWTYGDGGQTWLRVPKPHDWAILSNLIEASVAALSGSERDELRRAVVSDLQARNPASLPPVAEVGMGWMNYSTFRGGPIESRGMQNVDPSVRANSSTSPAAKFIGKYTGAVNLSPVKVDYVLNETSGGLWGKTLGAGSLEDAATKWSGTSAFTVNRDYSETIEEFYDAAGKAKVAAQTAKFVGKPDKKLEAEAARLEGYADLMTAIRAPVKDEKDRETRFGHEKYIIGLARDVLGYEELEAYPNPLPRTDLPEAVQKAVDEHLSAKLFSISSPDYQRQRGQTAAEYEAAKLEREDTRARALAFVSDADVAKDRQTELLAMAMKRAGMKTDSDAAYARRYKLRSLLKD